MGALFLDVLDERMEQTGLFYVRFMDDWVILAPSRWKLRKAVRIVNETLAELGVEQHPDKTFVGRIERGFTFLGYEFGPLDDTENKTAGLTGVAPPTIERFARRVRQLYEQGALTCLDEYVRRWLIWVRSGLSLDATELSQVVEQTSTLICDIASLHLAFPPSSYPGSDKNCCSNHYES